MYNTKNKRQLIDIFEQNKNLSFTAIELIQQLEEKMNRATIYRQLNTLEKNAVIRKNFNDTTKVYEYQYSDNCNEHFHLKCTKCGKIFHLQCSLANEFANHIYNHHGFKVNYYSSTILGVCKECSK